MPHLLDRLRSLRPRLRLRGLRTIRALNELTMLANSPLPNPLILRVRRDFKGIRVGAGLRVAHGDLHFLAGIKTGYELLSFDGPVTF